jgi:hypothetical protein
MRYLILAIVGLTISGCSVEQTVAVAAGNLSDNLEAACGVLNALAAGLLGG